jgi:hypothetical protein
MTQPQLVAGIFQAKYLDPKNDMKGEIYHLSLSFLLSGVQPHDTPCGCEPCEPLAASYSEGLRDDPLEWDDPHCFGTMGHPSKWVCQNLG